MKKRIQELAEGKFDEKAPEISVSTEKIELEAVADEDAFGEFTITSTNHVKIRGMIYASNPRMSCLKTSFEGEQISIRCQFHSEGLKAGDNEEGTLTIVCNQRECSLPFVVHIAEKGISCSTGRLRSLDDFVTFAQNHYEEAYHLFYSRKFGQILEGKSCLMHELLRSQPPSVQKFEEFLTANHKKNEIVLSISRDSEEFYEVKQQEEGSVTLSKSGWGRVEITVSSDEEFLIPDKKRLLEEDFLGNNCRIGYKLDPERMHAGKNYGQIHICTSGQHLIYCVMATGKKEDVYRVQTLHEEGKNRVKLTELYLDFRFGKIVTGEWTGRSVEVLQEQAVLDPGNRLWKLMQAQALIINRQRQEASWILNEFKRNNSDRTSTAWAYYLYLCTLMEPETSYVDRLTAEIERLFEKRQSDSFLFWILLFLREDYYLNPQKRLAALREWITERAHSPFFYLEVYELFHRDPQLICELDDFTVDVLYWAARYDVITKEVSAVVCELLADKKDYDKHLYKVLQKCREKDDSDEIVSAVCSYLIRWQKFEHQYHSWYQDGIERGLRITSLYEAFLLSMNIADTEVVPEAVLLYFQYNNSVPYRYLAMLYANLLVAKKKQPDTYRICKKAIKEFATEQMAQGHMDDNLAILYREILKDTLTEEGKAEKAAGILFTHKLCCSHRKICAAYILHEQIAGIQAVPVINGTGYFKAYTKDYAIMLLDTDGNCYIDPKHYLDEELFDEAEYREECLRQIPGEWHCVLADFTEHGWQEEKGEKEYQTLIECSQMSETYETQLLQLGLREEIRTKKPVYTGRYLERNLFEELLPQERIYILKKLLDAGKMESVCERVEQYGYETLPADLKETVCEYGIRKKGDSQDPFYLGFAMSCFKSGRYSNEILTYLNRYYIGPSEEMKRIWHVSDIRKTETFDLEERILTQVLYTSGDLSKTEAIYKKYQNKKPDEVLCEAYVSECCYQYLKEDRNLSEAVTAALTGKVRSGELKNEVDRLAYLKYVIEKPERTMEESVAENELLRDFVLQKKCFSFFRDVEAGLLRRYHLHDRYFLEYRSEADKTLRIRSKKSDDTWHTEELVEQFAGIYGVSWILFDGENVCYEIEELTDGGWKKIKEDEIVQEVPQNKSVGRYGAINRIGKGLWCEISYEEESRQVEQLFHLL